MYHEFYFAKEAETLQNYKWEIVSFSQTCAKFRDDTTVVKRLWLLSVQISSGPRIFVILHIFPTIISSYICVGQKSYDKLMLTSFVHFINSVIFSDLTISLLLATHHLSFLSYDVAVIQWITSCYKNRMTTRVITLWRVHVTSLTMSMSAMHFLIEIMFILKAIKSHLKGHMINRILHSGSFHLKFMKLAEGAFHKFHMK